MPHTSLTAPSWNSALTSVADSLGFTNRSPSCPSPGKGGYGAPEPHMPLGGWSAPWVLLGAEDKETLWGDSCLTSHQLPGKAPSSCSSQPSLLAPPQCLQPKGAPRGVKRQGDDHALSPSLPKWSPGWGWVDPQASAGALPWRVVRVICPPITGSRQHGHLRLASWPRHQATLAASSPPPAPPPPRSATGMAGMSLPLPRPHTLPPAHHKAACEAGHTGTHTPVAPCSPLPPSSHPLLELPPPPPWYRQWELSCLFT